MPERYRPHDSMPTFARLPANAPADSNRESEERGVDLEPLENKKTRRVKNYELSDDLLYISIALISSLKAAFLLMQEFLLIL